jgi:universal stress protein A
MTPKNILVATDLSDNSVPALRLACALAAPLGAQVTLAYVLEPTPTPPGLEAFAMEGLPMDWEYRLHQGRSEAANRRMEELQKQVGDSNCKVTLKLVLGRLPEALVEEAQNMKADLLVVGTHGRKGVSHLLLGSVAERLVRTAHCPVLVVRPEAAQ